MEQNREKEHRKGMPWTIVYFGLCFAITVLVATAIHGDRYIIKTSHSELTTVVYDAAADRWYSVVKGDYKGVDVFYPIWELEIQTVENDKHLIEKNKYDGEKVVFSSYTDLWNFLGVINGRPVEQSNTSDSKNGYLIYDGTSTSDNDNKGDTSSSNVSLPTNVYVYSMTQEQVFDRKTANHLEQFRMCWICALCSTLQYFACPKEGIFEFIAITVFVKRKFSQKAIEFSVTRFFFYAGMRRILTVS